MVSCQSSTDHEIICDTVYEKGSSVPLSPIWEGREGDTWVKWRCLVFLIVVVEVLLTIIENY